MRTLTQVIVAVAIAAGAGFFLLVGLPVLGFMYAGWRVDQAMQAFRESEILERSSNLPGVKAFLEKYPRSTAAVIPDFHLDVWYMHPANATANERATLAVGINLDTGYPQGYKFWCDGKHVGTRFPLEGGELLQAVKEC